MSDLKYPSVLVLIGLIILFAGLILGLSFMGLVLDVVGILSVSVTLIVYYTSEPPRTFTIIEQNNADQRASDMTSEGGL